MLQAINDKAKGIIGWVIIALISFTFALFGIADYLGDGSAPFAAKVDDTEISVRTYQEALSRQRQRLESMFGGNLPADAAFENRMKQQVMEQLIVRALIENRVNQAGYRVTNEMASNKIKVIESFQQDGQFASAMYKQVINSQGMSLSQFENIFKGDMIVQQMQDALMNSSIVGNGTLLQLNHLQQQIRDVSYIEFKNNKYTSEITLTDEEIQQYYDQNSDRYMYAEQASISYVEIKTDDISSDIEIDEEVIRRQYDEYVASMAEEEQRQAKHILIQLDSAADEATKTQAKNKVDEALAALKSGASFEDLAKKFSDDPGSATKGGDLGWINRGMMGDVFDNALFKLNKNEISEIVQSSFGYHIIKLVDIKGLKPDSYESKKAELVKELKQEDVEKIFYERSELMATLAYENDDTLQPVADALELKIKQTGLFTRSSGLNIASNKAVRDAAFNSSALKEGRNSDVIELSSHHILVLRVDQHVSAKPKKLEEVKPVIEIALKAIRAKEKVQADGLQALVNLQQGQSLKQLAKAQNISVKQLGKIKRDYASADQAIVREAFQMNKPEAGKSEYKTVELANGVAVIVLNSVIKSEVKPDTQQLQALAKNIESGLSNQEMTAVIDFMKSQSDIVESKNL
jgi:peptidyl-prolyl cis-trans isomerase D